ncbi:MAG: hypothetical protein BM557_03240 [Flavobacterium sp. MedPE-SWcel]|uniref:hypothetical protein n=1 Tax=uncultured Flavobacterium sp. TaxID=165435 RepID=UPI0009163E10|nr:hypothetical protein [uncultured Flavobacterium sp.]OIQ21822.1 MAG: hypothetical protein BM557_03240 [Flavobacterium sp. MedPE-SWcel]
MESIIKYFKDNLKIDLSDLSHPISSKINSIYTAEQIERNQTLNYLMTLGLSLEDIKEHDKSIYNHYIQKIKNNKDTSVHGHIFEINQCALLINKSISKGLSFKFGDHNKGEPDFIIDNYGFEITSVRFSDESNRNNPGKKLLKKFRDKNRKTYTSRNTALLIETSQISYHAYNEPDKINLTYEKLTEIIIEESKFGIVLLHIEWIENENHQFMVYPIYSKECNPILKDLITNSLIIEENPTLKKEAYPSKN